MKFVKMHGTGNDYIYIDGRNTDKDWPALARAMSDRHFGVGADGIILFLSSENAHLKMRMFNADGSEGEMCGNGIRCLVKYAIERHLIPQTAIPVTVETLSRILHITPIMTNELVTSARVNMGNPILRPIEVPVALPPNNNTITAGDALVDYPLKIETEELRLTFVSMGNPHAVTFIEKPVEDFPLSTIGPKVERHPMFPKHINFEIVNIESPGKLKARVWERGSGETLSCGSGACAISVAAHLKGISNDVVDIILPGGTLKVEWDGQGEVLMEGPTEEVFEGEWKD